MERLFFVTGSLFGFFGVLLGAFGTHALKHSMDTSLLMTFETGVRYQMYHAFALLAATWAYGKWPGSLLLASGWLFIVGTILFSGSLYLLSLSGIGWLGAITPVGGLALIAGWLCMAWAVRKA